MTRSLIWLIIVFILFLVMLPVSASASENCTPEDEAANKAYWLINEKVVCDGETLTLEPDGDALDSDEFPIKITSSGNLTLKNTDITIKPGSGTIDYQKIVVEGGGFLDMSQSMITVDNSNKDSQTVYDLISNHSTSNLTTVRSTLEDIRTIHISNRATLRHTLFNETQIEAQPPKEVRIGEVDNSGSRSVDTIQINNLTRPDSKEALDVEHHVEDSADNDGHILLQSIKTNLTANGRHSEHTTINLTNTTIQKLEIDGGFYLKHHTTKTTITQQLLLDGSTENISITGSLNIQKPLHAFHFGDHSGTIKPNITRRYPIKFEYGSGGDITGEDVTLVDGRENEYGPFTTDSNGEISPFMYFFNNTDNFPLYTHNFTARVFGSEIDRVNDRPWNHINYTTSSYNKTLGETAVIATWIDDIPPNIDLAASDQWFNNDFSQSVTESDDHTGLNTSTCEYRVDDGNDGTWDTNWQSRTCNSDVSIAVEGDCSTNGADACNVTVRADDEAGNTGTDSELYNIDTTPPDTAEDPSSRSWDNTDVSVDLTASDSDAGVDGVEHCWTTTTSCTPSNFVSGSSKTVTQSNTGNWTLCFRANDTAGNLETTECSGPYQVDKVAPSTSIDSPSAGSWQTSDFSVSTSDSDADSGLDTCEYRIDDGDDGSWDTAWASRTCDDSFTVSVGSNAECSVQGSNQCNVTIRVNDTAGNRNTASRRFSIDYSPPDWSSLGTDKNVIIAGNSLQFHAFWEDEVDLGEWELHWNYSDGTWKQANASWNPGTDTFSGSTDWSNATETLDSGGGTFAFHFTANDTQGNRNTTDNKTFIVQEKPKWRNQTQGKSSVSSGDDNHLWAYGRDEANLTHATLYVNDTGDGDTLFNASSIQRPNTKDSWELTNFTYDTTNTDPGTTVEWFIEYNDTDDLANNTDVKTFTVSDGEPPKWKPPTLGKDPDTVGEQDDVTFHVKWEDNNDLSDWTFEWNYSSGGSLSQDGTGSFSTNPDWSNITKNLGSTRGTFAFRFNATDTAGNENATETRFFTVFDKPNWDSQGNDEPDNTIRIGEDIELRANGSDEEGLASAELFTNESGSFQVEDSMSLAGNVNWSNFTRSFAADETGVIGWFIRYNDTNALTNETDTATFRVIDTEPPQWQEVRKNDSNVFEGDPVKFVANWSDNVALDDAKFAWNHSGSMQNLTPDTIPNFDGSSTVAWSNTTEKVTSVTAVKWRFWANDTAGNWNRTPINTFTIKPINSKPANEVPPPQAQFTPDYTDYRTEIDDVTPIKLALTNDLPVDDVMNVTFQNTRVSYTVETGTAAVNETGQDKYAVAVGSEETVNMIIDITATQAGSGNLEAEAFSTASEQTDRDSIDFAISPKTGGRFVQAPALTPPYLLLLFLSAVLLFTWRQKQGSNKQPYI